MTRAKPKAKGCFRQFITNKKDLKEYRRLVTKLEDLLCKANYNKVLTTQERNRLRRVLIRIGEIDGRYRPWLYFKSKK